MSEAPSLAEINREHWNTNAKSYDHADWIQTALRQIGNDVLAHLDWIGVDWVQKDGVQAVEKEVRMLDYACGPGNTARTLYPHVSQVRGVDLSERMVEEFNSRAAAAGLNPEQMSATQGDILADPESQPAIAEAEFFDLDLITCSMAFHHLEDPDLAAKRLVKRLKLGKGVILIIDWVPDLIGLVGHQHGKGHGHGHGAGHQHGPAAVPGEYRGGESAVAPHPSDKTIAHEGFSKQRMEQVLQGAGCVKVDYIVSETDYMMPERYGGLKKKCFMARGTRAG